MGLGVRLRFIVKVLTDQWRTLDLAQDQAPLQN